MKGVRGRRMVLMYDQAKWTNRVRKGRVILSRVRRTATRVTREMERLCHAMKSNDPGDGVWSY
jgi:hypothetical protein